MTSSQFSYASLLSAGLPAPAVRWTGLAKYSFVGGNNDPDGVPVDGLVDAVTAVLKREGKSLATYNLAHGPQGYGPLREFLVKKLKRDAGIACTADDILMLSGSSQALDLVNAALLTRGDTVICEKDNYQSTLTRFARIGAKAIGLDDEIGSIEPGKRADIIAVRTDTPRMTPLFGEGPYFNLQHNLVHAVRGSDVAMTMVDGEILVDDGELKTGDLAAIIAEIRKMAPGHFARRAAWLADNQDGNKQWTKEKG